MQHDSWQFEVARWWPLVALLALPLVVFYARQSLWQAARRQRNLSLAIRCALLVVLSVAACGPRLVWPSQQQMVVVAVDRSMGAADAGSRAAKVFVEQCRPHAGRDRLVSLKFAAEPADLRRSTNLDMVIARARALVPGDYVPRIVLLSDGRPTSGDALGAAQTALGAVQTAGCPIDVVPLPGQPAHEVYLASIAAPALVDAGEPFHLDVTIYSSGENRGALLVQCDGTPVVEKPVEVDAGDNRFRFPVVVPKRQAATFSAELTGFDDTLPDNNAASTTVFPGPAPRVLLVESRPVLAEPLRQALQAENIRVEVRAPESIPKRHEELQSYELLLLSDVPATAVSNGSLEAIEAYVRDSGGGLIVVGGNRSFTPGGYGGTVLEKILPVRPYARTDRPKPRVALVLAIDRSGSMKGQSIELARLATRQAVENLTARDQVGVVAFEDRVHWISRLAPVDDKQRVLEQIETIAAGGGTNMYPAMDQAYQALDAAFADRKHIIVLSDGLSHPGDYHALAGKIAAAGITVSTVGVGPEAARELLRDVATLGGGNFYSCEDATAVPRIFALETMAAGKLGIREEPFLPRVVQPAEVLAGLDFGQVKPLLGYAETQLKPTAQLILAGEDNDPLLAWWQYGAGTAAAFTSDVQSRWAAAWLKWDGFGRFWAQTVRHVMRRDAARGFALKLKNRHGHIAVTLDALDPRGQFINRAEGTLQVITPDGDRRQLPLPQVAPGRYAAALAPGPLGMYTLEIALRYDGQLVYLARRGFSVDYREPLRVSPTDSALLRAIAETTGGRYDPAPDRIFAPTDRRAWRTYRFWPPLVVAGLLLFLLDVWLKRTDWETGKPTPAA